LIGHVLSFTHRCLPAADVWNSCPSNCGHMAWQAAPECPAAKIAA
jgi:hypothetical protein